MKTKLLLLLLLANFSIYAQTNLVPNGDFETWTSSSQPDNWYRYLSGLIYQNSSAQKGNSSTKMEITSGTFNYMNSSPFAIQNGKTYRITLYQKLVSGTFSSIELSITKSDAFKTTIKKLADATSLTSEWRKIEFDYVSTTSQNAEISVWITGTTSSQVLIDNISVVDVAEIGPKYTLIPDVNFEKKLIALGYDSDEDGKVLTSKISSITELNLYSSNISDLTGIQDFQSLANLNCMSNKLTNLDVSSNIALTNLTANSNKLKTLNTSKNIALQYLSISYNEITDLDLSQNVNLTLLSCISNKLSTIDTSKNLKLYTLWCSLNQLTTIDVSKNTSLNSLQCSENKLLTSVNFKNGNNSFVQQSLFGVDFTKNPLLTCILVDKPIYSNEKWGSFKDDSASYSTVECSQITAIPDPTFEDKLIALNIDKDGKNGTILNSSITNITSLDVSSSSIKDLTGIKGFISLTNLNCSGNLITSLDLSKNTVITIVNSSNNKLLNLNLKNGNNINLDLSSNFKNNPDLNCIQVDDETLSINNWSSIKDNSASYSLDCNAYTLIPDSNFEDKLIALEIDKDGKNGKILNASVKKVTYLDLSNSNISDITGIEDFTSLTYLDLSTNNLNKINVSKNTLLLKLDLNFNKITQLDVRSNKELINLRFAANQISTIDLSQNKKLYYITVNDNSLTNLDLSANNEIQSLSCGLNKLTTLDTSNLSNLLMLLCESNQISALNLSNNPKLDILQCYSNNLTSLDLTHNTELTSLSASSNQLTSLDLSQNKKLVMVHLVLNPLTSLNVQNGNNENFIVPSVTGKKLVNSTNYSSFLQIKTLSCIQVDNVAYSNANWSGIKEPTVTYSTSCKNLGIEDSAFEKIAIYPNPTKGEVTISNVTLEKASVYNTLGQLVRSFTLDPSNTNNTINLSGLPKGIYYVYLINEDAASAKKVIVE